MNLSQRLDQIEKTMSRNIPSHYFLLYGDIKNGVYVNEHVVREQIDNVQKSCPACNNGSCASFLAKLPLPLSNLSDSEFETKLVEWALDPNEIKKAREMRAKQ